MATTVRPAAALDGASVLTLAQAKAQLRRFDSDEDDLIGAMRDSAIAWVERYTGLSLVSRGWIATFDRFDPARRMGSDWLGEVDRFGRYGGCDTALRLPRRPVTAVASVTYSDTTGAIQNLDSTAWRVTGDELRPAIGAAWPVVARGDAAVTVTFTAGFAAGMVPADLLAAVRMLLTHLMINRSAVTTGAANEMPLGPSALCDQHRTPVIG